MQLQVMSREGPGPWASLGRWIGLLCLLAAVLVGGTVLYFAVRDSSRGGEAAAAVAEGDAAAAAGSVGGGGSVGSAQTTRLRITNGCKDEPMWIAQFSEHEAVLGKQNVKLAPGSSHDVEVPQAGFGPIASSWYSKWRCVDDGNACAVGDSGGPGQRCDDAAGCAPPLDSKLSARLGKQGKPCNTTAGKHEGCDFIDISLQDGYTVPFKLVIKGDCGRAYEHASSDRKHKVVDCSRLSVDRCPADESLGEFGSGLNLQAINPTRSTVAGCYSPCTKLSYPDWVKPSGAASYVRKGPGQLAGADRFCCSSLKSCDGTLSKTAFVRTVHEMCPGVNAFDYDRGMGVGTCPAGTRYEMVFFCPDHTLGSSAAGP